MIEILATDLSNEQAVELIIESAAAQGVKATLTAIIKDPTTGEDELHFTLVDMEGADAA